MRLAYVAQKSRAALLPITLCAVFVFAVACATLVTKTKAYAATMTGAKVSFTFDDGLSSALTTAAPILQASGYSATDYAITGCVGTSGTCPANEDASYMTWDQLTQLKNTFHWEIGSHTVTHPLLTTLGSTQLQQELANSKSTLLAHGFNPTSIATPYGDYNNAVLAQIARYYGSHRPFADQQNPNTYPYNDYLLYVKQVQAGVTVSQVKSYIDQAKANGQWLVLVFHDIKTNASTNPDDYEYKTSDFQQVVSYVKAQGLPAVNVSDGLAKGTNLLPNATFDAGVGSGWTTDAPTNVVKDGTGSGSYPSATNAIKLTAATDKSVHLFSPLTAIDASKVYTAKCFLNVQAIKSGEVTFYIDEYDGTGNWISGQYKAGEKSVNVESLNFNYKPTSTNVKQIRYQIAVSANSGIKAYVDNAQLFAN